MQCKPMIGLNADYRGMRKDSPAYSFLSAGYYECILQVGGIPVIVPPLESEDDLHCVLDRLDAFVLVGGGDLDPRRDGFMLHPTVRPLDERRETFDRMLMRSIADRRMPVFGIGGGHAIVECEPGR